MSNNEDPYKFEKPEDYIQAALGVLFVLVMLYLGFNAMS